MRKVCVLLSMFWACLAWAAPTFSDRAFGGDPLNPGDERIIVQVITIRGDPARDTRIEFVHVRNIGTATSTQITQIALAMETSLPISPTSPPTTTLVPASTAGKDLRAGIIIPIPTPFTVPPGPTSYLWVMVNVAGVAAITGGETLVLETNLYWHTAIAAGNSGFLRDGRPETIQKAWFEVITDDSPDPATLNPADSAPVQRFRIRDLDANARPVKINKITVKRASGATAEAPDLEKIEVEIIHGVTRYTGTKTGLALTTWHTTGVEFTSTDFTAPPLPASFPDEAELRITVTITVKTRDATHPRDGRTIRNEVVLEVEEPLPPASPSPGTISQTVTGTKTWTIRRAGFEEAEERSVPPAGLGINPGERLTQKIWVADRDYNTKNVQITHIWVKNLGTAETADIAGFTVWVGATQVHSGWPVGFVFHTGGWIPVTATEVADEGEATITIEYRVSPLATIGRTIRPEVRVGSEEPPGAIPPTPAYATVVVTYPQTVTIHPAGFETVENIAVAPATVYSSQRFVAQKIKLADKDANTVGVTITRVLVRNMGTASDDQFTKLEVRLSGEGGALLAETTSLAGFRTPGITLTPTANNTVADEGTIEIWIWLTLAGPDKTVAGRTVQLETVFSFTEGTVSGETPAVRGTSFAIGINRAPVVHDFTWSPASPQYDQEVTFTPGTITDPDGDAIVYSRWDFGAGADPRYVERHGPPAVAKTKYPLGGTFNVTLVVRDAKGLEGAKTKPISVTPRPNHPPAVDFSWTPEKPMWGKSVKFTPTVSDPDGDVIVYSRWDFGADATPPTEVRNGLPQEVSVTFAQDGKFDVTLLVRDARGLEAKKTKAITVTWVVEDISIPAATVHSAQRFVAQKIRLTDKDRDTAPATLTKIKVKNEGTAADAQFVKLEVRRGGEDGALLVETTSLSGFRTTGLTLTPVANNVIADDATVEIWIWLTLAGPDKTEPDKTVALETAFTYTKAWGSANTSAVRGTSFIIKVNQPPLVDFTWSPTAPVVGQAVSFTPTVSDPDTPFTFRWTFGDGASSIVEKPTHTYRAAGTYTVRLEVTDARGAKGEKTRSITIATPPPPTVTALSASPAVPEAGKPVTFTATATAPEGDPVTAWEWDFNGDGTVDATAAPPVTHTYPAEGVYTVKVRARNRAGWSEWRTLELYVRPKGGALIGIKVLDNPATTHCRIQVFVPPGAKGVKITILDIAGRLVLEKDVIGPTFTWDLKDRDGRIVPNGLYLFFVTATIDGKVERSEIGRILVQR